MDFDFKIKLAFVLFMGLIMSACASRPVPHGDFVKDRDTAAKVVIYIPHSEWKCSGLLIPDTEMGGKFTAIAEVFHDKTTSYVFNRVQA